MRRCGTVSASTARRRSEVIGPYECFACGKITRGTRAAPLVAVLVDDDGRWVMVGPDCHKKTRAADGYLPARGGPRLFFNQEQRSAWLAKVSA